MEIEKLIDQIDENYRKISKYFDVHIGQYDTINCDFVNSNWLIYDKSAYRSNNIKTVNLLDLNLESENCILYDYDYFNLIDSGIKNIVRKEYYTLLISEYDFKSHNYLFKTANEIKIID